MANLGYAERRGARNQALTRDINERVVQLLDPRSGNGAGMDLLCECYDKECVEMISVSRPEYETIRQNPRRFPVRRGHVLLEIESVVRSFASYDVVEKFGEAGDVVTKADRRGAFTP